MAGGPNRLILRELCAAEAAFPDHRTIRRAEQVGQCSKGSVDCQGRFRFNGECHANYLAELRHARHHSSCIPAAATSMIQTILPCVGLMSWIGSRFGSSGPSNTSFNRAALSAPAISTKISRAWLMNGAVMVMRQLFPVLEFSAK